MVYAGDMIFTVDSLDGVKSSDGRTVWNSNPLVQTYTK